MGPFHPTRDSPSSRARVRILPVCWLASLVFVASPTVVIAQVESAPEPTPESGDSADTTDAPPPISPEEAAEAALRESGGIYVEDPIEPPDEADSIVDEPENDDLDGDDEDDDAPEPEKRVRFTGFPFAFYLPETSVGFGFGIGVSALTERPREGSRDLWFPSNLTIGGAYTIRRQMRILLTPELYLRRGKLVIDGTNEVRFYPDRFYGLGRNTDERFQRYTDVTFRTSTSFRYQLVRGIYVGAVFDAAWTSIRDVAKTDSGGITIPDTPSNGWLGTGAVRGERGSTVIGFGPTVVIDRRDYPLMSRSGYYIRLVGVGFPGGGPFTNRFFRSVIDVRGFVPFVDGKLVLGGQWLFSAVHGSAPFNHLASVGGPVGLRSYPDGRFRDAVQTFTQLELRFPIVWRIRGAVHVGTGAVFGPASQGREFEPLWAVGLGLRAVIFEDRRVAVRGDLVLGPEGLRVLAYVHEAF